MSVVTDTTNHSNRLSAAERRALRAEAPGSKAAADLVASGALDGLFARIDAGEMSLSSCLCVSGSVHFQLMWLSSRSGKAMRRAPRAAFQPWVVAPSTR